VHEPSGIKFSHGCIYNREASFSFLPSLQLFFIVFPLNLIKLALEGVLFGDKNSWEEVSDVDIKISPM